MNDRPLFANGKDRSTIDPVWRHGVKAQYTAGKKSEVAAVNQDMRKFYDSLNHSLLRQASDRHGFGQTLVDVAANAYAMARTVTYGGQAGDAVYATRGIIAGDSLSDALVKVYYLDLLDTFTENNPLIDAGVFVGDFLVTAEGERSEVRRDLVKGNHRPEVPAGGTRL